MFEESLRRVVHETEGGLASVVMGFDGISLEEYTGEAAADLQIASMGMEYSVILRQIRTAMEMLDGGELNEVSVRAKKCVSVIRVLTKEYFLCVALKPDGNLGKARYLARMVAPGIRQELE